MHIVRKSEAPLLSYERSVHFPVIAIDGYAGTGKGTARHLVAKALRFHELDSGCLYRAVAFVARSRAIPFADWDALARIACDLQLEATGERVIMGSLDVTLDLRSHQIGVLSKEVAQIEQVRAALRSFQLAMRKSPGLVADGRDMGEIFKDPSCIRFFLYCDKRVVAKRRYDEYRVRYPDKLWNLEKIYESIVERDLADETRIISPLKTHPKATVIDTTNLSKQTVAHVILSEYRKKLA